MPRVPQSHNSTTPVEKFDNTAYDAVELVAQNIDAVIAAAGGVDVMTLYLGAYDTEPTQGHDGEPLVSGNFYLDTTSSSLKYWDATNSVWVEADVDTVVTAAQDAQAARDAAQAAQTAAETAETNATTQASNAASSASTSATSASNAATSESNASVSEGNAATSANNAANSATAALASENAASTSETNAATSETNSANSAFASAASESNAAASAVSAANSASQAEAAFDNFDDMYLGRKTVEPTVDNDGNPLQVGASYWHDNGDNTGEQRFWNGASWESPELTATQAAQAAVAARDDAQISETNAANSASAAGVDANNAGNSATAAANSASAAAASETAAEGFKDAAETAQSIAQSAANAAGLSESNAAASEAAAELAASTVTWKVHTRGEAELNQMREQNKDARAASGFDNYGTHVDSGSWDAINEGMFVNTLVNSEQARGKIILGEISAPTGTSETNFPVTHIAGFISEILGGTTQQGLNSWQILLPDAPNGTVIYDSTGNARGSGSANLDLTVDVDPKYGDVASDQNEAVARAFEGDLLNGDFRNAFTNWTTSNTTISNGLATITGVNGYVQQSVSGITGVSHTLEVNVTEFNSGVDCFLQLRNAANNASQGSVEITGVGKYTLEITPTEDGVYRVFCTSGSIVIGSLSLKLTSEEVVIDRHDMFGGEFFLEEVSVANPFVYPKGMVQSQATTMNGITTVSSNRPSTYYAVFDGDTGSAGLGVDFWAATDQEKIDMVSDHSNNIFLLADGRVVQWRMRQRTVVGLGNGDWHNLDPTDTDANGGVQWDSNNSRLVLVQGHHDSIPYSQGDSTSWDYFANNANINVPDSVEKSLGVFCNRGRADSAVDDLAFFHVWGVVRRLNQGAYHPSFNPLGANQVRDSVGNVINWYHSLASFINSTADCLIWHNGEFGGGAIGGVSGRDDDRFYDAIYEGGDGGVNDHRLSAWDMSSKEEAAKVFQKVVNGTYRGEEQVPFNGCDVQLRNVLGVTGNAYIDGGLFRVKNANTGQYQNFYAAPYNTANNRFDTFNWLWVRKSDGKLVKPVLWGNEFHARLMEWHVGNARWEEVTEDPSNYNTDYFGVWYTGDFSIEAGHGNDSYFYARANQGSLGYYFEGTPPEGAQFINSSVSGEFQMVDVIGDPADILATPDLANGWQGGWIPVIPNGTSQFFPLTRKALSNANSRQWTNNNGDSWLGNSYTDLDTTRNGWNFNLPATQVQVNTYTAFAKQTVEADNEPVLNGSGGLGDVVEIQNQDTGFGSLLAESMMGKVCTSTQDSPFENALLTHTFVNGELSTLSQYFPKHAPVNMPAPNNDSPAVKVLWYQSANNQQVSMNFAWNELVYKNNTVESTTGDSTANKAANSVHAITSGRFNGMVVQRNGGNTTGTFDSLGVRDSQGNIYFDAQSMLLGAPSYTAFSSNGNWGDDSTIRVTDGTDTYTNRNGDTCLRGSATLSKPIGYTKNQARVGEQVKGVDL